MLVDDEKDKPDLEANRIAVRCYIFVSLVGFLLALVGSSNGPIIRGIEGVLPWYLQVTLGYLVPPILALVAWVADLRWERRLKWSRHHPAFALLIAVAVIISLIEFRYSVNASYFYPAALLFIGIRTSTNSMIAFSIFLAGVTYLLNA